MVEAARCKCPICRRPVAADSPEFPFCSRRCRVQDLANWAEGCYVIHSPLPEESEDAGLPQGEAGAEHEE